jgi:uncharacterized RDD family membrane protein YckC
MSMAPEAVPGGLVAPGLWRRMAAFLYEGVLLFGVLMIAAYLYSSLTQQRNAMFGRHGLQAFLFVVLGIYFVWFWSHGGQTVAMKAWNLRLVGADGRPVSQPRALARYILSWMWFMPALVALDLAGLKGTGTTATLLLAGIAGYALLARLHPERQFLHDVACGTRLIHWQAARRPPAPVSTGNASGQNAGE